MASDFELGFLTWILNFDFYFAFVFLPCIFFLIFYCRLWFEIGETWVWTFCRFGISHLNIDFVDNNILQLNVNRSWKLFPLETFQMTAISAGYRSVDLVISHYFPIAIVIPHYRFNRIIQVSNRISSRKWVELVEHFQHLLSSPPSLHFQTFKSMYLVTMSKSRLSSYIYIFYLPISLSLLLLSFNSAILLSYPYSARLKDWFFTCILSIDQYYIYSQ